MQVTLPVVPDGDVGSRPFLGVFADPRSDLVIGRAGRDERPVRIVINLSKLQPPLIERTVGVVFPLPADEGGAAFVHRTGGQDVAAQRFTRAARKLFAVPQIAGEQSDFVEVFLHALLLCFVVASTMNRFMPDMTQRD